MSLSLFHVRLIVGNAHSAIAVCGIAPSRLAAKVVVYYKCAQGSGTQALSTAWPASRPRNPIICQHSTLVSYGNLSIISTVWFE